MRQVKRSWAVAVPAAALALSACGAAHHPRSAHGHRFPVTVTASLPARQQLGQHTRLVIDVRNTGSKAIPNVAVTISNPRYGNAAQSFGKLIPPSGQGKPILASRSRPVWIVTRNPGVGAAAITAGGAGGAATANTNTWALGRLAPGAGARFAWSLTAVQPGRYTVAYTVAPGLTGNARAVIAHGRPAAGRLRARISSAPRHVFVTTGGKIVHSR